MFGLNMCRKKFRAAKKPQLVSLWIVVAAAHDSIYICIILHILYGCNSID